MYKTIREFCKETGLSYVYVRQLIRENQIPFLTVGKRFLIPVESGLAALEELSRHPVQQ